jgi:hypothetical protein
MRPRLRSLPSDEDPPSETSTCVHSRVELEEEYQAGRWIARFECVDCRSEVRPVWLRADLGTRDALT